MARTTASRAPLPTDLVDAVAAVLEREAHQTELAARAELLSRAHETVQGWLEGTLSTKEAIARLAADADPKR